jgi:hypothetical protein
MLTKSDGYRLDALRRTLSQPTAASISARSASIPVPRAGTGDGEGGSEPARPMTNWSVLP